MAAKKKPITSQTKKPAKRKAVTAKNTGKPYELLTREVFARMKSLEKVGAKVEHDVTLMGKSGTDYQIDVLITIEADPVHSLTLIQCKDWGSKVKREHVAALHAAMNDIPGNPGGFFVARSGYQSGAQVYAQHQGIKLYELREAVGDDWTGFVQSIGIAMSISIPHVYSITPVIDREWVRQRMLEVGVDPTGQQFNFRVPPTDAVFESGKKYDLNELLQSHYPKPRERKMVELPFEPDDALLFNMRDFIIPQIRCTGLTVDVGMGLVEQPMEIRFDEFVKYHFLDVLKDEGRFLGEDGGPPIRK